MNWPDKMKALGIGLFVVGLGQFGRGLVQWNDPPIQDQKWYYGTTRQLTDVGYGIVFSIVGIYVYRTGRLPK